MPPMTPRAKHGPSTPDRDHLDQILRKLGPNPKTPRKNRILAAFTDEEAALLKSISKARGGQPLGSLLRDLALSALDLPESK